MQKNVKRAPKENIYTMEIVLVNVLMVISLKIINALNVTIRVAIALDLKIRSVLNVKFLNFYRVRERVIANLNVMMDIMGINNHMIANPALIIALNVANLAKKPMEFYHVKQNAINAKILFIYNQIIHVMINVQMLIIVLIIQLKSVQPVNTLAKPVNKLIFVLLVKIPIYTKVNV